MQHWLSEMPADQAVTVTQDQGAVMIGAIMHKVGRRTYIQPALLRSFHPPLPSAQPAALPTQLALLNY